MTTTTKPNTWSVFFDDRKYRNLLGDLDDLLNETKTMYKQGYRPDVIDKQQQPKVEALTESFKQFAINKMEDIKNKLDTLTEQAQQDYSNPQSEMLKRQDLSAKIDLLDNTEVIAMIVNASATNTTVYEVKLFQDVINKRFTESEKNKVAMSFETLKQNVLYPERNNDEYAQLEYSYNVINQTGMANSGVVVTENEYGSVDFKTINDRYTDTINSVTK
ncbi:MULTISPECIES: hypothetical protein [Staphylococcus]|uniref:hypothetical protein n=1 Tax=Staphylococcus TaxID=1279 RepID=UPI0002432472|nr:MULTISPECIES: hypothetical protein [Staphylococcus]EHM70943.1 hypothetical protein HMPREF9956_0555 [Staphylococcus epidermidis 14.1.R1.SE]APT16934.1 hypothetical protein BUM85_08560 [Staphylococcus epidermidis]MCG1252005.1 hypothetical protein [Staphylococcus epidermidis]MCG1406275.1 hypothetical protein [Staphylococcus epidermidis]MCG1411113.1 hypothetical protein [Staphylococcus epidermidis]